MNGGSIDQSGVPGGLQLPPIRFTPVAPVPLSGRRDMTPQAPLTGRRNFQNGNSITVRSRMSGIIQDTESRIRGEDDLGELNSNDFNLESQDPSAHLNTVDSGRQQNLGDFSDGYRYKPQHNTGRSIQPKVISQLRDSIDEEQESEKDYGTF